jgi:hypothetical protein
MESRRQALNRNGGASAGAAEEEKTMAANNSESAAGAVKSSGKRRAQSPRLLGGGPKDGARYFIGKSGDPKPLLELEVASEPEGLVIAFKTDARLFVVHEFTVEQKIERGRVSLEKAPAPGHSRASPIGQRVSTTNAS